MVIKKRNFRIIEGPQEITDELKNKIIRIYTDTDNTKADAAGIASNKYNVSRTECVKILRNAHNKPFFRNKVYAPKRIEENGGLDLIKAFRMERWTFGEMCNHFGVDIVSLNYYIKEHTSEKLPFREEITDEDVQWVKKKHGIE